MPSGSPYMRQKKNKKPLTALAPVTNQQRHVTDFFKIPAIKVSIL